MSYMLCVSCTARRTGLKKIERRSKPLVVVYEEG
jgi:hypothetical protein